MGKSLLDSRRTIGHSLVYCCFYRDRKYGTKQVFLEKPAFYPLPRVAGRWNLKRICLLPAVSVASSDWGGVWNKVWGFGETAEFHDS